MKKCKLQIAYVVLLTLCVPLSVLYFVLCGFVMRTVHNAAEYLVYAYLGLGFIYWVAVVSLGIANIVKSFQAFKRGDALECVNGMMIHKYGLIGFFVINFLLAILVGLLMIVGSRGTIIFAFPIVILMIIFAVFFTWLALVPGAFWGIQTVRITYGQGRLKKGEAVLHGILQFVFLADVCDAAYLSIKKWGKRKR